MSNQQQFEDAVESDQPVFAESVEDVFEQEFEQQPICEEGEPIQEGEVGEPTLEQPPQEDEVVYETMPQQYQYQTVPGTQTQYQTIPGTQTYYTIPQTAQTSIPGSIPAQSLQYSGYQYDPYNPYQQFAPQISYYTQPTTLAQETAQVEGAPATEITPEGATETVSAAPMYTTTGNLPTVSSMTIPMNPYQNYGYYGQYPGYGYPSYGMPLAQSAEPAVAKKKKNSCNCF